MTARTVLVSPAAAARFRELAGELRAEAALLVVFNLGFALELFDRARILERVAGDRRLELRAVE